jgi:CBS domain-containing protein
MAYCRGTVRNGGVALLTEHGRADRLIKKTFARSNRLHGPLGEPTFSVRWVAKQKEATGVGDRRQGGEMREKIIPDVVHDQPLTIMAPGLTVHGAAEVLAARNIGAVIVADNGRLVGICTERDIVKVVAAGRDAKLVTIGEVMTPRPLTVSPDETPIAALMLMRKTGILHLPVVDGERIVGIVSVRDLNIEIQHELEDDLKLRDEFIAGGYSAQR